MKVGNSLIRLVQRLAVKDWLITISPSAMANEGIASLNANDRKIFEALCQFVWIQGEPTALIFDVENVVYTKQGITLSALKHLEVLGLINYEPTGFIKKRLGKHTRLFYCGKPTKIGFLHDENNQLDLGHVLLTEAGKELALIFTATRNQEFYEYVIKRWHQQGFILSSIQVDQ